jgi:hypothetical protein
MDAPNSSETLQPIYQITTRHTEQDRNFNFANAVRGQNCINDILVFADLRLTLVFIFSDP